MANGKKTDQQRIAAAERRLRGLELRKAGCSIRQIAAEQHISVAQAHDDLQRSFAELAKQEAASTEQLRSQELAKYADWEQEAVRILYAEHPLVSAGRVLSGFTEGGKAIGLTDDGPKLAAIDRLIRISESRRKLLGLDLQSPLIVEQPYVLTEPERIARLIELLDAARARATGQPLIDVTPEPGDVAE